PWPDLPSKEPSMKRLHLRSLAAAASLALWAGACPAVDLMTSYERALGADPAQRAANEALTAGREKAIQGDALLLPRVELTGSLSRSNDHTSSSGETLPPPLDQIAPPQNTSGTTREVALQLKQPIYDAKA